MNIEELIDAGKQRVISDEEFDQFCQRLIVANRLCEEYSKNKEFTNDSLNRVYDI
jgi:hypothetical protein